MIFKAIFFVCILFALPGYGQANRDTNYLKQQAEIYLTKMYVKQQFDSAVVMWDENMFRLLANIYKERKKGKLKDSALYQRVKSDITKYYKLIDRFKIDNLHGSSFVSKGQTNLCWTAYFSYTVYIAGEGNSDEGQIILFLKTEVTLGTFKTRNSKGIL